MVASGPRLPPTSCDTSLVVSGGIDCVRKRRNVYYKKPQRYAKDNRTAHLTARSDKSIAYLTNNKRLYSTFCTIEANYWQTQSIARPLCDSRPTCFKPPPAFDAPVRGSALEYCHRIWFGKTRMVWLRDSDKILKIWLLIILKRDRQQNWRTYRHTDTARGHW